MTIPTPSPSEPERAQQAEPVREARPYPCPNCESTRGYSRLGKFRSQCLNCNSTFSNADVNRNNQEPQ